MAAKTRWLIAGGSAAVALTALLIGMPTNASQPYEPTLEFVSIGSSAPGANADITFRTSLPAGNHVLGSYLLNTHWGVAGFSNQLRDKVAAVVTMTVNLDPDGNCLDGDSGTPQSYGPAPLTYKDPNGGGSFHATWSGNVTDFGDADPNTKWTISFNVDPAVSPYNYELQGFMAAVTAPPGHTICTPQVFTVTFCGRANPTATATTCGSGSDPAVMTNPNSAGCYNWEFNSEDESGQHLAVRNLGVSIGGTPCPTPTPTATPAPDSDGDGVSDATDNCPTVPNPDQSNINSDSLGDACDPDDYDLDAFTDRTEYFASTDPGAACAASSIHNAWPPDFNNDRNVTGLDLSAVAADIGNDVPPAPPRKNIAPDPPDTSITGGDLSRVAGIIGTTCAASDQDGDGVPDADDNCPTIYNPDQRNINPTDGVGDACDPDDFDLDAFSDRIEYFAGTLPGAKCAVTVSDNAWPPDFNNDRAVTGIDLSAVSADLGTSVPPAPARKDIAPDPPDKSITGGDLSAVAGRIGESCTP